MGFVAYGLAPLFLAMIWIDIRFFDTAATPLFIGGLIWMVLIQLHAIAAALKSGSAE